MTYPDPALHSVSYAFDAAFRRMREADSVDALMAEHSNLLHHLYRLRELCKARLTGYYTTEGSTGDLRAARAASWVRNFDTHQLFESGSAQDVYSDYYTAMYGVLVWKPLAELPSQVDKKHHREGDYRADLENKQVLDTMRRAFDAMAGLLATSQE